MRRIMRPRSGRPGRTTRRPPRQPNLDSFTARAFEELERPPPNRAKDFLGAAATLAITGAILAQVTNSLAVRCRAQPNPLAPKGTCSGISAVANHARGLVTWGGAACAALLVAAFIWYMFWGYETARHPGENPETPDSQH